MQKIRSAQHFGRSIYDLLVKPPGESSSQFTVVGLKLNLNVEIIFGELKLDIFRILFMSF